MGEPEGWDCKLSGHDWQDAGGGLEICSLCEGERWAEDDYTYDVQDGEPVAERRHR
jgi:hypothetical protein